MMDKIELENAIKSIFLQCLNEPDIAKTIGDKLNYASGAGTREGNQMQQLQGDISESNNLSHTMLIGKMDEILRSQKRIEELFKSEIVRETRNENKLSDKLRDVRKENGLRIGNISERNEKNIDQYKEKLEYCQRQIEELRAENERLKSDNTKYSVFEESLDVWKCIDSLNYNNRVYIESLCGGSDVLAILSLGRDDGKIEQLWMYLRDVAVKGGKDETEVLKLNRYFEFCLKVANATKPENEKYVILDTEPGSEFDIETCIKTTDSKQIGYIKDVVVRRVHKGEAEKYKAIVRVE
jgi:hypothetical protein